MKTKNKSKKLFFSLFLLITITGVGTLGVYGSPYDKHVYAQESNDNQDSGDNGGILEEIKNFLNNLSSALSSLNPGNILNIVWRGIIEYFILLLPKILIELAGHIFAWIINPKVFENVVDNSSIYYAWTIVRDILNIGFIMTLLFSAFATIFGVESYSYGKTLPKLIIVAFLVNFSFPIARFIIDFSNVLMYYLVGAVGLKDNGLSAFTSMGAIKSLTNAVEGVGFDKLIYVIVMANFLTLLAITLLVIAALFLVRTIALVLLIIFSPVGLIGIAVPVFSSYSKMWWDSLVKYSFFGPVMVFMLYIALKLAEAMGKTVEITNADMDLSNYAMTYILLYSIPLITLWAGIIIAQKMSIIGANEVRKYADMAGKKVLMWGTGAAVVAGFGSGAYKAFTSRGTEGNKNALSNRFGSWVRRGTDNVTAKVPGATGRETAIARTEGISGRIDHAAKQHDLVNKTTSELNTMLGPAGSKFADNFAVMAATSELAGRGLLDVTSNPTHKKAYDVLKSYGTEGKHFYDINNKIKKYDPVTAFSHITDKAKHEEVIGEYLGSGDFNFDSMNAHSLGDAAFVKTVIEKKPPSIENVVKLKGDKKIKFIESLEANKDSFNGDDDTSKNAQLIRFSIDGKVSDSKFLSHISQNITKENSSRINKEFVENIEKSPEKSQMVLDNIKAKEIPVIINGMEDESLKNKFFHTLNSTAAKTDNAKNVQGVLRKSSALAYLRKNGKSSP